MFLFSIHNWYITSTLCWKPNHRIILINCSNSAAVTGSRQSYTQLKLPVRFARGYRYCSRQYTYDICNLTFTHTCVIASVYIYFLPISTCTRTRTTVSNTSQLHVCVHSEQETHTLFSSFFFLILLFLSSLVDQHDLLNVPGCPMRFHWFRTVVQGRCTAGQGSKQRKGI